MKTRVVVLLLGAALVLSGCVSFPESGTVQRGIEGAPEPDAISLVAEDPQPGDTPEQIVRGFLAGAGAGTTDDFAVARQYLTDATAEVWDPSEQVVVYSGAEQPVVEETDHGRVEVTVSVSGTVDADGVYTPASGDASTTMEFGLNQGAQDQWRINELGDGVLVSEVIFGSQYRQIPLYFLTADGSMLVPDTRWYPHRNAPTAALRGLLAGPVDWLDGAVFSAIPANTSLTFGGVTVSAGTAQVDLTAEGEIEGSARTLIRSQIEQTLLDMPQVQRVEIAVDGADWGTPVEDIEVTNDPSVGRTPMVLDETEQVLSTFTEAAPEPLNPMAEAVALDGYDVGPIALGYDSEPPVMRTGTDALITVPTESEPEPLVLLEAPDLVAPSYDRHGWIWTGSEQGGGDLIAVRPTGEAMPVVAEGLAEAELTALRVSRDGARVAVVATIDEVPAVEVYAVIRDENGMPVRLGAGVRILPQLREAGDLVWVDEQTVAVLGRSGNTRTVHLGTVGGPLIRQLPTVPEATQIASARGDRELYVINEDGELFARSGLGWRQVASGVAYPSFPG